jgi:AcrR family transcriptional regulator
MGRTSGHKERLLAGAKRCLYEKGYGRTTARDIVEASGANLASIGYHFGTKEALLSAAMMEAIDEWGEELGRILAADTNADPLERFEAIWARVIESFDTHRTLWVSSLEAFREAERSPELRTQLADGQEEGRFGLVALFQKIEESAVDERAARTVGSFYLALVSGLMVQWLTDPSRAPSGADMAEALRTILEGVRSGKQAPPPSA